MRDCAITCPSSAIPMETPENPDAPDNGDRSPAEGVVNELEARLFKGRKVMVFGQIRQARA
jgi:hypothetical protein